MNLTAQKYPGTSPVQKYLGNKGLIALIALLSAFVPISTDLYLPALPGMSDYFHVSADLTNLTLILFFIFFSAGMLVWGPLSDKYGRRPILLIGLVLYIASSATCAISGDIWHLIISRVLQALGGSAAFTVATAIVKDVYTGKKQESVLAVVQSMIFIAPAVAPVLGAFMLPYTSWRGIFWALALVGVLSLFGALLLEETIPTRSDRSIGQSMIRLGTVLKNRGFSSLLLIFSLTMVTSLSFVAASAYIFERGFGLSEQEYSLYFALNALGLIVGPFLYLWLSRRIHRILIINFSFLIIIIAGVVVCLIGNIGPLVFSLSLLPASIMTSCVKTPGTFLMLDQQKGDTGSAAALINSIGLIFGTAGMYLVSFNMSGTFILGALNVTIGLICLSGWLLILKQKVIRIQN